MPARAVDGLRHGFLCADAFQYRIRADAARQFLDPSFRTVSALTLWAAVHHRRMSPYSSRAGMPHNS